MMENENVYRRIQDFFGGLSENFSLIENPVDVAVQIKYFEISSRIRGRFKDEDVLSRKGDLFDPTTPMDKKKILIVQLAGVPSPEAYRALESYAKNPDPDLKDWANMAMQESKLLLESYLLDNDRQVFISTGLGGKGNKLRYFVVLLNKEGEDLKPFQQKVVQDEIQYALQRYNGELEKLNFTRYFVTMLVILPISSDLTKLFREGIEECNQFGNFLMPDFIVTNLKELSNEEINEALEANHTITDDDFPPVD